MVVAGIDGGATRTRVAIASETGTVVGFAVAGPSNFDNVGIDMARSNIGEAVEAAFARASMPRAPFAAVFLGMAGVVSEADRNVIRRIARDLRLADVERIFVDHDIRIALAGGLTGREGIVLIAGTGSSCYGRRNDGRCHQIGWGYLLDDLGSGFFLGQQAMIAAVHAHDGRGRQTSLSDSVQNALGYDHIDNILHVVYHEKMDVTRIASLAPLTLQAAEGGDEVALEIVRRGANELSRMAYTVAERVDFLGQPVPLTMVGGLVESNGLYKREVTAAIARCLPQCQIQDPELPPVLGAVLLALESAGILPAAGLITTLKKQAPQFT